MATFESMAQAAPEAENICIGASQQDEILVVLDMGYCPNHDCHHHYCYTFESAEKVIAFADYLKAIGEHKKAGLPLSQFHTQ